MQIPSPVMFVLEALRTAGYEAYAVGGCVRDFALSREPKDWDVATSAKPDDIQKIFSKSFYENKFGTVTVLKDSMEIQVTTYRIDNRYSDKRHPDSVKYTSDLKEDLTRRDFTMNAMALDAVSAGDTEGDFKSRQQHRGTLLKPSSVSPRIIDPFNGQQDLRDKLIRAVGDPKERFGEDALRLMRAARFAAQLDFLIEENTLRALKELAPTIKFVSHERIRDELVKIIMSVRAGKGIDLLRETGLLAVFLPEVMEGYGVGQNKHHIYDVYEHNMRALQYAAEQGFNLETRLASLFHDVAKPRVKVGDGPNSTFYNHDLVGAKMTRQIMQRMKFSTQEVEKTSLLVRYHLFYYNVDEVTPSSVRRLIKNVGLENMDDLINVRFADRIGSGVPKAEPYKLRHFRYMVDKVSKDPISVKMLKINGDDVMKILGIPPGPKVGILLQALFSEVLDDPSKNEENELKKRTMELDKFSASELSEMIRKAEERVKTLEDEEKRQYRV